MDNNKNIEIVKKREILKQLGLLKIFFEMKDGQHGIKKQLLAYMFEFQDIDTIEKILSSKEKELYIDNQIPYIKDDYDFIENKFGFKKRNIKRWKKINLISILKILYYTPKCLVEFVENFLSSVSIIKINTKPKYKSIDDICIKCHHKKNCPESTKESCKIPSKK